VGREILARQSGEPFVVFDVHDQELLFGPIRICRGRGSRSRMPSVTTEPVGFCSQPARIMAAVPPLRLGSLRGAAARPSNETITTEPSGFCPTGS
jgi:hypothetical protein